MPTPAGPSWTDVAAWWGAATGTLVLAWDVYKWSRRGAALLVEVSSDMLFHPPMPGHSGDESHVLVTVTNVGDQPTTLTNMAGFWYRTRWQRLIRRPEKKFVALPLPITGQTIPHVLKPGERWMGAVSQENLEEYLRTGRLECGVFHSGSKKAQLRRVAPVATSNKALQADGAGAPPLNA
jgi:hypothetical protein